MSTMSRRRSQAAPSGPTPGPPPGHHVRAGLRDALTVVVAYIPFSLALGAALATSGVDPFRAWASSPLMFGGAAQLVTVQLLADGTAAAVIVSTALVMNSRHLLYGASLAPHTRGWTRRTRGLAATFLADPVYALAIARFEARPDDDAHARLRYYLAMAVTCWVGWLGLTAAGGLLAGALPTALPLHLAAPLTFLLLLIPTLKDRPGFVAAGVAGAVAVPAADLPLGLGLLVAATCGIAAGYGTERIRHA